jgi:glutathione S-transferase
LSLRLHDYVLSAECYTVRLMLALLALPHTKIAVDVYPGGAQAPVLEDGDATLSEPGLILAYLARQYDRSRTWLPAEGGEDIAKWLTFAALDLSALNEARRIAVLGQPGDLDVANAKGRVALRKLEDHFTQQRLADNDWVVGTTPTIADIAIFPAVMLSHDSGIGHEDYPAINLWQRRLRKLPGFVGMPGIPDYF